MRLRYFALIMRIITRPSVGMVVQPLAECSTQSTQTQFNREPLQKFQRLTVACVDQSQGRYLLVSASFVGEEF